MWPARHYASSLTGTQYPPMGARFRLRAGFDISGFSAANQVILRALKKYGMILADNGSAWYLSGAPDSRWNNDDLHNLGQIHGSDFEAVDVSGLMIDPNSGQAAQSTTVTVTVSPSRRQRADERDEAVHRHRDQRDHADRQLERQRRSGRQLHGGPGQHYGPLYGARRAARRWHGDGTGRQHGLPVGHRLRHRHRHLAARRAQSELHRAEQRNAGHERHGDARRFQLPAGRHRRGQRRGRLRDGRYGGQLHQITATFVIAATAATGARSVTVTTSAGSSAAQSFTVNRSPGKANLDVAGAERSLSRRDGDGHTERGQLHCHRRRLRFRAAGVSVSNVVVVSSSKITATFHVSQSAARRAHDTSVTTAAGTSNVLSFVVQ